MIQHLFQDVACGEYFRDTSLFVLESFAQCLLPRAEYWHSSLLSSPPSCQYDHQYTSTLFFLGSGNFLCAVLNKIEIVSALEVSALKLFP